MLDRIKKTNLFQKILMSLLLAAAVVFAFIYPKMLAR